MTFTNLDQFNKEIAHFADDLLPKEQALFMRALGLKLLAKIVKRTPVGNPSLWKSKPPKGYVGGRARGNWQVAINGATNESEVDRVDADGEDTVNAGTPTIDGAPPFGSIHIFNNVPYIIVLEEGDHSSQAPEGMVVVSIEELRAEFPD